MRSYLGWVVADPRGGGLRGLQSQSNENVLLIETLHHRETTELVGQTIWGFPAVNAP